MGTDYSLDRIAVTGFFVAPTLGLEPGGSGGNSRLLPLNADHSDRHNTPEKPAENLQPDASLDASQDPDAFAFAVAVGEMQGAAPPTRIPPPSPLIAPAIGFVGDNTERIWNELARKAGPGSAAERVLRHEATHLGEFGFHRILFAGFSETDDPAIRRALRDVYERLLGRIAAFVGAHRRGTAASKLPANTLTAWALLGLGTATNLGRELGMLDDRARKQLFATIGAHLLG